jgi:hypothetical protein
MMRDTERLSIDWESESNDHKARRPAVVITAAGRTITQMNTDMRSRPHEPISVGICGTQEEETTDGIYS